MNESKYVVTEADRSILLALGRFDYLTAAQANRLLYPNLNDNKRYVQRRLKRLVDNDYALRLRALPMPRYGQAPHVFTLGGRGRVYLQQLGFPVEPYFRPSEERRATENNPFMTHRLAAIDVMIAADRLCRTLPSITCPRMLSERELKRHAVRVHVPSVVTDEAREVAVIPDAWFQLARGISSPYSIAVELDRGTEDQKVWRRKVAAYIAWVSGPYMETFETDNVSVAVVCSDHRRVAQLLDWTRRELRVRNAEELGELFLFTSASPVTSSPRTFFFSDVWFQADTGEAVPLLDTPSAPMESGVVFKTP